MNNENGQYSLSYYSKIICKTEVSGALPQAWSIREKSHCRRDFNKKYLFVKFILACRSQERDDIRAAEGWMGDDPSLVASDSTQGNGVKSGEV